MPAWPSTLPQTPDFGGWTLAPQSNMASFEPEVGPPITRRRASSVNDIYEAKFTLRSNAQRATFLSFYANDLVDGTLTIDLADPFTGAACSWKIIGKPPFRLAAPAFGKHELTMTWIRVA